MRRRADQPTSPVRCVRHSCLPPDGTEPVSTYDDIGQSDFVIEAVFERIPVKEEGFKKLDEVMKPGALLYINSSGIDIDIMASPTKPPFGTEMNIMVEEGALPENSNYRKMPIADMIVETGRLGQRTGAASFPYEKGSEISRRGCSRSPTPPSRQRVHSARRSVSHA